MDLAKELAAIDGSDSSDASKTCHVQSSPVGLDDWERVRFAIDRDGTHTPDVTLRDLDSARLKSGTFRRVFNTFTVIIRELCLRRDFQMAAQWWDRERIAEGVNYEEVAVLGMRALGQVGRVREVFEIVDSIYAGPHIAHNPDADYKKILAL